MIVAAAGAVILSTILLHVRDVEQAGVADCAAYCAHSRLLMHHQHMHATYAPVPEAALPRERPTLPPAAAGTSQ